MPWLLLYIAWVVSEILIAILTRTRAAAGTVHDRSTMPLLWLTIVLSLTACGLGAGYLRPLFPEYFRNVATALMIAGLAIRWASVLSLGNAFSANVAIRGNQRLNQSGFYRLIRHPSYLGLLFIFFALGLHARNPVSLACAFLPTTAMLLYRIHVEEAALVSAFGNDYRSYKAKTKRLVPWVY